MAMFEAKKVSLNLECKNQEGEVKTFIPKQRVTAAFAEKLMEEHNLYLEGQKELPQKEKDKTLVFYLKFMSWAYKDLDTAWLKANFTHEEIKAMFSWVNEGLLGVKKDEES